MKAELCPKCNQPLLVSASLCLKSWGVICINVCCPANAVIGAGDTRRKALKDFEQKAEKK